MAATGSDSDAVQTLLLQSGGQAAVLVANSSSRLFDCLSPCLLGDIWAKEALVQQPRPQRTHAEADCRNELHVAAPRHKHKQLYS